MFVYRHTPKNFKRATVNEIKNFLISNWEFNYHMLEEKAQQQPPSQIDMALQRNGKQYLPSNLPRDTDWPKPKSMSLKDINDLRVSFVKSSSKANKAGLDVLEIHMAHGYLLHQFLSPISNKRNDNYGGNLENGMRLPLEIAKKVRHAWPKGKSIGGKNYRKRFC